MGGSPAPHLLLCLAAAIFTGGLLFEVDASLKQTPKQSKSKSGTGITNNNRNEILTLRVYTAIVFFK